jgi:hypothetical protein
MLCENSIESWRREKIYMENVDKIAIFCALQGLNLGRLICAAGEDGGIVLYGFVQSPSQKSKISASPL